MQNSANHKLVLFFCKAVFLALLLLIALFCFTVSSQYSIVVNFVAPLLCLCGTLGLSLFLDFRKIQRFNWGDETKEEIPINIADSDLVKIAKRYINGATYDNIKEEFHFSSNEQVKRAIQQRLKDTL